MLILTTMLRGQPGFFDSPSGDKARLLTDLSRVVGARRDLQDITRWLQAVASNPLLSEQTWRAAALIGLAEGLKLEGRIGRPVAAVEKQLVAILRQPDESVRDAAIEVAQYFELRGLIEKAVAEAADETLAINDRISALRILRGGAFSTVEPVLQSILTSPSPQDLQQTRYWVKVGKLPSIKPGRFRLVERVRLNEFLRRNARGYEQ